MTKRLLSWAKFWSIRSSRPELFCEMVLLEISQNSQENSCVRASFLIKLQVSRPATLFKKRPWHRCFPVNFAKFLRTLFYYRTPPVDASKGWWHSKKRLITWVSHILKYIGYTKPSLAMYVLHNLHGQLSQYHDFMFSLSGDREGAWLISVGTKFHNRSA